MLRNLESGADEKLTDVLAYQFDDSAKVLAYTVASHDSTKDGVYIRNLATGAVTTVLSGPGNYRAFAFDRAQQQFVFTSDRDEFGKDKAKSVVYHGTVKSGKAEAVIKSDMLPPNMRFPDNFSVSFNRAATALTFNIAPPAEDTIPADSLVGKSRFDLWHWKDPHTPAAAIAAARAPARNPTFQAIYSLSTTGRSCNSTTDSFPSITLSEDGKVGVANTGVPYNIERMWGDGGNDIYLVDPATATRKLIRRKISGNAQLSVDAHYVIYYDNAALVHVQHRDRQGNRHHRRR